MTSRPKNPSEISFDAACFEIVGERVEFVVPINRGSASYPRRFANQADAEAFARRISSVVEESRSPIRRRIRWN